jgi:hypothetical protein
MDSIDKSFWEPVGKFCEEMQQQIDNSKLDPWRKEKAKGWLNDCVEKGKEAREQDGDGLAVFKHETVPLKKHIDFFGKGSPSRVA